jgi:hypothetical protein
MVLKKKYFYIAKILKSCPKAPRRYNDFRNLWEQLIEAIPRNLFISRKIESMNGNDYSSAGHLL